MAATWCSSRVMKDFHISLSSLSAKIGINGSNIAKHRLVQCKSFPRERWTAQLMQQANLFRLQCSNPVGNYLKSPWSLVPLRGLRHQVKITNTWTSKGLSVENGEPLFWGNISNRVLSRRITTVSKKGKRKTCKAVAKRFIRTGKGKLKRWRCGKHHNQSKKRNRRKRFLRKPTYVSKTQLKTLNKMLNGW